MAFFPGVYTCQVVFADPAYGEFAIDVVSQLSNQPANRQTDRQALHAMLPQGQCLLYAPDETAHSPQLRIGHTQKKLQNWTRLI